MMIIMSQESTRNLLSIVAKRIHRKDFYAAYHLTYAARRHGFVDQMAGCLHKVTGLTLPGGCRRRAPSRTACHSAIVWMF